MSIFNLLTGLVQWLGSNKHSNIHSYSSPLKQKKTRMKKDLNELANKNNLNFKFSISNTISFLILFQFLVKSI